LFSITVSADDSINLNILFTEKYKRRGMWGILVKAVQDSSGLSDA